jgi:hypothetical protein
MAGAAGGMKGVPDTEARRFPHRTYGDPVAASTGTLGRSG